jgi:two-component system, response regulator PdtaR
VNTVAASSLPASTKGRILVVDDDRLVLATVTQGLSDAGYEVFDADNGDDAILLAREHRPQLALLDIRMQGMSGFDVAETLRDPHYGVPFMFLSAFADEGTRDQVRALGALDYLVKPLDVDRIVPRVDAVFSRLPGSGPQVEPLVPRAPEPAQGAAAAAGQQAKPSSQAASAHDPVALAVGVLMHRHALSRQAASAHLQRLAGEQGHTVEAQAERLLGAVEELARSTPRGLTDQPPSVK